MIYYDTVVAFRIVLHGYDLHNLFRTKVFKFRRLLCQSPVSISQRAAFCHAQPVRICGSLTGASTTSTRRPDVFFPETFPASYPPAQDVLRNVHAQQETSKPVVPENSCHEVVHTPPRAEQTQQGKFAFTL